MDLTSEQRMIIEAEASDLAVVAGAGSGKTHVLVERRSCANERLPGTR